MKFLKSIGNPEILAQVYNKARASIPAYKKFLTANGVVTDTCELQSLPIMDKANYIKQYPFTELITDPDDIFVVFKSSGYPHEPHLWPFLKNKQSLAFFSHVTQLVGSQFGKKRILAINCLAKNGWFAGEMVSLFAQNASLNGTLNIINHSTSDDFSEILTMIDKMHALVDEVLIFIQPSLVKHLLSYLEKDFAHVNTMNFHFIFMGEYFSEETRALASSKITPGNACLTIYGSSDSGGIGVESKVSIIMRNIINNLSLQDKQKMGIDAGESPIILHYINEAVFAEDIDGELVLTAWQGIPLIRYNLKDKAKLAAYRETKSYILSLENAYPHLKVYFDMLKADDTPYPDLLFLFGRSDRSVSIFGAKIYDYVLDQLIRSPQMQPYLSGEYRCKMVTDTSGMKYLHFDLEASAGREIDANDSEFIRNFIIKSLCDYSDPFKGKWTSMEKQLKPEQFNQLLQIKYHEWPSLYHTRDKKQLKHSKD